MKNFVNVNLMENLYMNKRKILTELEEIIGTIGRGTSNSTSMFKTQEKGGPRQDVFTWICHRPLKTNCKCT